MLHSILQEVRRENSHAARNSHENYNVFCHNVRLLLIGSQSLAKTQLNQSKLAFPNARIVQTFACAEAASSIAFSTIHDHIEKIPSHEMASLFFRGSRGTLERGFKGAFQSCVRFFSPSIKLVQQQMLWMLNLA